MPFLLLQQSNKRAVFHCILPSYCHVFHALCSWTILIAVRELQIFFTRVLIAVQVIHMMSKQIQRLNLMHVYAIFPSAHMAVITPLNYFWKGVAPPGEGVYNWRLLGTKVNRVSASCVEKRVVSIANNNKTSWNCWFNVGEQVYYRQWFGRYQCVQKKLLRCFSFTL